MRNIAFKILLKFKTSKLIKLMVHKLNLKEIVWFGFFSFLMVIFSNWLYVT